MGEREKEISRFGACPSCGRRLWYSVPTPYPNPDYQFGLCLTLYCMDGCGYEGQLVGIYDWFYDDYREEVLVEQNIDIKEMGHWKSSSVVEFRKHLIDDKGFIIDTSSLGVVREIKT